MRILACGHGHYDHGHCGTPGCDNDFRRCPECNPPQKKARPGNPSRTFADGRSSEVDPWPGRRGAKR